MRFFDWRGLLLGCAVVGVFLIYYGFEKWPALRIEKAIANAAECVDAENSSVCARPHVEYLLERQTGTEIMEELGKILPPQQCHYIGHVVGQQSYVKFQDFEQAIAQCDRSCDSACLHGVIGEGFAQELGFTMEETFDLQHLSPEDIRRVGAQLCKDPQTCHGVGHTLFAAYGEFAPGLAMCREVSATSTLTYCYQGLFMEYADILSSRNMGGTGMEYPTDGELEKLCDLPTFGERRSCFRYYPRMVISALRNKGSTTDEGFARLRDICRGRESEDDHIACIVGLGVYISYSIFDGVERAIDRCERFTADRERVSCHLGQVSVATEDRKEKVMEYCDALPNSSDQKVCYQGVLFYLNRLGSSREEMEQLCTNDTCRAEMERVMLDPWTYIKELFPE